MSNLLNLDLFSVGISVAAIGILGFVVFFNGPKSITNQTFLTFSIVTLFWGVLNYFEYHAGNELAALWFTRFVIFFAVWQAFLLHQLFLVLPKENYEFSKGYKFVLVPIVLITSLITLSPWVILRLINFSPGQVPGSQIGLGIVFFGIVAVGLVIAGLVELTKKTIQADKEGRSQFIYVLFGAVTMFALIIVFNFILAAFFQDFRFIPLGAVFILPFVIFTTYAILRHHLLGVKVIATEILTFFLAVVTLFEVVSSTTLLETLFRSLVFILVLIFGIFLIRSVQREVEQREELQRLDKELEEKNTKLDELSHFKSELLSLASHQIRSPLAAIKGFATLIVGGSYGETPDKIKETVGKMGKSADELIGLINTLLDVRKVEEGRMEYQFEKTDLNKMVGDVVDALKSIAENKKLEFNFASPGKEIWVNADPQKFKQVIQNLTDNALKYTPSGFVHVELKEEAGDAIVSISDSGLGIPASLVPHLFEEFIRDERVKKQILGTGLGLYIANKIAESHGGKISAESPGEGKGSTFRVTIPEMK